MVSNNEIPVRYEINRYHRSVWVLCQQLGGIELVWLCVWSSDRRWSGTTINTRDQRFIDMTKPAPPISLPYGRVTL